MMVIQQDYEKQIQELVINQFGGKTESLAMLNTDQPIVVASLGVVIMHIIYKFNMWAILCDFNANFIADFGHF